MHENALFGSIKKKRAGHNNDNEKIGHTKLIDDLVDGRNRFRSEVVFIGATQENMAMLLVIIYFS